MFQYQGWATLKPAYCENENFEAGFQEKVLRLEDFVTELRRPHFEVGIRSFNGEYRVWILGFCNRKNDDWCNAYKLFECISENLPGSYGILSCWDDEDQNGKHNEFQNYVLRRGSFIYEKDTILSPCFDKIEDLNS